MAAWCRPAINSHCRTRWRLCCTMTVSGRGAAAGFAFNKDGRGRIWNTFDAHRLLHWAGTLDADRQRALKHALLRAYYRQDPLSRLTKASTAPSTAAG